MRPSSLRWLIPFALVVLLLAACSDSDDEAGATTVAPTTTQAVTTTTAAVTTTTAAPTTLSATPLRLTFDGEDCTYDGPVDFGAGPVELSFTNLSEELTWIAFNRHTGDQTIQDAIDHFGAAPSSTPCPSWKVDVVRTGVYPGDTYSWEGELEAATYHMVCYRNPPVAVWFGTGLTVES